MSRLDDILDEFRGFKLTVPSTFQFHDLSKVKAKRRVKELFLGLIGEDVVPDNDVMKSHPEIYLLQNELRAELRQKVKEL